MRATARLILSITLVASAAAAPSQQARGSPGSVPTSTPPPTPVPPFGSPSPFPTSLVTPAPSTSPPTLSAPSAELADLDTGQVLYAKAARARRPMASVTKIMTALVVLERLDPSSVITVRADAASQTGALLGLRAGERISVRNLMHGLLLSSANDAAVALADAAGGSVPGFVRLMNRRARAMGLRETMFTSPTGLDDRGHSTARDLMVLTRAAYGSPLFAGIVRTKAWDVPSPTGPPRHIQNRNPLLWLYPGAIGVKTGTTFLAGHCLVAAAGRGGIRVAAVVLGAPVEAFDDAAALLNFGLLEFRRTRLVRAGEHLGTVTVAGANVPGVAVSDLVLLVRDDRIGSVGRVFRPLSSLALPIALGAPIGREDVAVEGTVIGSVAVVAAAAVSGSTVPPAPVPPARLAGLTIVYQVMLGLFRALIRAFL